MLGYITPVSKRVDIANTTHSARLRLPIDRVRSTRSCDLCRQCALHRISVNSLLIFMSDDIRVLRCVIKASKQCLGQRAIRFACKDSAANAPTETGQIWLSEIIIEKAASYDERLRRDSIDEETTTSSLLWSYLFLRIISVRSRYHKDRICLC